MDGKIIKSIFCLMLLFLLSEDVHASDSIEVIGNNDKEVRLPKYVLALTPALGIQQPIQASNRELLELRPFMKRLPAAARTIYGKHVGTSHIDSRTIFVNSLVLKEVKHALNCEIYRNPFQWNNVNRKLGQLFRSAYVCEIKPLIYAFSHLIADRLEMKAGRDLSDQCQLQHFGQFTSHQLAYIQKYLHLRENKLKECTVADYIGLNGLKSILRGDKLCLSSKGLTGLEGLSFLVNTREVKNIALGNNSILGPDLDPDFPSSPFERYTQTTCLTLSSNPLCELPEDFLKGLTSLRTLEMIGNGFQELPANLFVHTPNLTDLKLSHNRLTQLHPEIFHPLTKVVWIFLDQNRLKELPENLFQHSKQLFNLNVAQNRLTTLPHNLLSGLVKLHFLTLDENSLSDLSNDFFHGLRRFHWLSIQWNDFEETEGAFREKYDLPCDEVAVLYGTQKKRPR